MGDGLSARTPARPTGTRGNGGVSTEAGAAPSGGSSQGLSVTSTAGKSGGSASHQGTGLSTVKPGHSKAASPGSRSHKGRGVSTTTSSKGHSGK